MPELRVVLVCQRCARLELRYVKLRRSSQPDVMSFRVPKGWSQRWDDDASEVVVECEQCAAP